MGRIMAIDYGKKRTGLAVTDPERIIATGLTTVETPKLMQFMADYFAKETVDTIVVGEPKQMDNTPSESARYIEPFLARKEIPRQRDMPRRRAVYLEDCFSGHD